MWRKLKFLHKWINFKFLHMTDVEKSEISFVVCTIYGILLHFTLFCCQICFFLAIYAVLSHYRFFRFTHYYMEKNLAKHSARGEKMTNMRYEFRTNSRTCILLSSFFSICGQTKFWAICLLNMKGKNLCDVFFCFICRCDSSIFWVPTTFTNLLNI